MHFIKYPGKIQLQAKSRVPVQREHCTKLHMTRWGWASWDATNTRALKMLGRKLHLSVMDTDLFFLIVFLKHTV